ncbi:ACT domain-containing protein [Chloroflexus sp.]|uniref:ACT domain-containing protein n=1 Tax=Chloroflexus sp. TaxID=1904827 RepID=UPI002ACDC78D|nr:ACT domain-containing protein [Chloroflexus sp.]
MPGETDVATLLATMQPVLHAEAYAFCTITPRELAGLAATPLGIFREREGVTVIVTAQEARQHGLSFNSTWAYIELTVHSALTVVGFLAVISQRLAEAGISVNVVSAYYHDHLFVPWERRAQSLAILDALASQYRSQP